ncbi:MAG: response regulator [Desulfobacteraceae bacterium]|jgi:PAS domain S-box-containing protein
MAENPIGNETPARHKVLVVDDDPGICSHLAEAMRIEGYDPCVCHNPEEALGMARAGAFGLVFVDIHLPGMSGLDLASRLREEDPEREVVFITGYGNFDSVLRAIKIGAYDYLRKPFDFSELNLCLRRYQERQELKEKARSAERRYFDLVQNVPLLIWVLGRDHALEFVNETCRSMLGFAPEEATGRPGWFLERIHPSDRERIRRVLEDGFESPATAFSAEFRLMHRNGSILHALLKSLPHGDSEEFDRNRLEGVVVDITDRVLLEKALVQREKVKTLGAVSAEVAHEIRNPLVSIGGFARRLQEKCPEIPEGEIILNESRRLERILDRIRDYLKPVEIRAQPCSVNEAIRACVEILERDAGEQRAALALDLDESIPPVHADPDALTETLITLVRRALASMDEGDALSLQSSESVQNVQVFLRGRIMQKKFGNFEELLLPFDEGGEGLGLPLSYKMLRHMGGLLSCEREGDEVVFTVSLPKWEAAAASQVREAGEPPVS